MEQKVNVQGTKTSVPKRNALMAAFVRARNYVVLDYHRFTYDDFALVQLVVRDTQGIFKTY